MVTIFVLFDLVCGILLTLFGFEIRTRSYVDNRESVYGLLSRMIGNVYYLPKLSPDQLFVVCLLSYIMINTIVMILVFEVLHLVS